MHRERKRRQKIIFSLMLVLMLMVLGYAAFQSRLDIKGTTKVTSNWEVIITNVSSGTPSGNAENSKDENGNVILPTWDNLSASMSADLYEAGDSMEYIVTITNRGNLDATLDEIIKTNSSNSAVIITYSGYAEGQKLYKNSSLDIKVKISYNPEYSGGKATGTSNITFSFKEADSKVDENDKPIIEDDTIISKDDKTITYNCQENGGAESNQESIFDIGTNVDLNVKCTKEGYEFLGWNTDKDATSVLESYEMPNEDKTLYGIYKKEINITYTKDSGVKKISKDSDTCTIYNKTTSCDKTLPKVTLDNDSDNTYYELDGWYIGDTKIENPGSNHTYTENTTVEARTIGLPVMMSGPSFQTKIDSVKQTVTEIEFVDTDEVTPPTTIDNTTSWDVSEEQNGSVVAWLDGTKMYVGRKNGVIGNSDCSRLVYEFKNLTSIEFNHNFDTSKVIIMSNFFTGCIAIENINLQDIDVSNVVYMGAMFYNCSSLINLEVNNWNTKNVKSMNGLFGGSGNKTTKASTGNGGGIYISEGKVFNMTGGTISNNYCANCGGGLTLSGGVEHTFSGGTITGNEAVVNSGGILLSSSGTKLTMTGGTISQNKASRIGGIHIYNGSIFEMNGGIIKNNIATSSNSIGGVYLAQGDGSTTTTGTFTYISGVICENTPANSYETHTTCPTS